MRPIIAPAARPADECWLIAAFQDCWDRTGRGRWMNWKRSSGGDQETAVKRYSHFSQKQREVGHPAESKTIRSGRASGAASPLQTERLRRPPTPSTDLD